MSDVLSTETLSRLSRKLRSDSIRFLAREYLGLNDADLHNLTADRQPEEANYEILKSWKQRNAGTAGDLRALLEQARHAGIDIDSDVVDSLVCHSQGDCTNTGKLMLTFYHF